MEPVRSSLPHLESLGRDPVRLCDADDTDQALRRDLAGSCNAVVIGIDYAALAAELRAAIAGSSRDACA